MALAAWVGAAAIFVVTAVHEVQSPKFTSPDKSHLAILRFPTYYQFGFTLVSVAMVAGLLAIGHPCLTKRRAVVFVLLVASALGLMLYDYYGVYAPLQTMLHAEEEGAARPESFQFLHQASKRLNTIDVTLCFLAAVVLCWPEAKRVAGERPVSGTR